MAVIKLDCVSGQVPSRPVVTGRLVTCRATSWRDVTDCGRTDTSRGNTHCLHYPWFPNTPIKHVKIRHVINVCHNISINALMQKKRELSKIRYACRAIDRASILLSVLMGVTKFLNNSMALVEFLERRSYESFHIAVVYCNIENLHPQKKCTLTWFWMIVKNILPIYSVGRPTNARFFSNN